MHTLLLFSGLPLFLLFCFFNFYHFGLKFWQCIRDDPPEDLVIDMEISMSDHVPQSGNLLPCDRWIVDFEVIGEFLCSLANNFKIPDNSVPSSSVGEKFSIGQSFCIFPNIASRF